MNISEQLQQNPVIAVVIVISIAVGVAWKVFHSLYVSPRDFKIAGLKDDMAQLQEQVTQLQRAQRTETPDRFEAAAAAQLPSRAAEQSLHETQLASGPAPDESASPLSSLNAFYAAWSDEKMTKLQKQKFEADLIGKRVSWTVSVDSVSEAEFDRIYLFVTAPTTGWDRPRAVAHFPVDQGEVLLALNKGDRIQLEGTVDEFFMWPRLTDCRITRSG